MSDEFVELGTLADEGIKIVSPQEYIAMHAHHADDRPGHTYRFGDVKVFFLAYCHDCWPDRWAPMPFYSVEERDKWMEQHATTGHLITKHVEVRC